MDSEIDRSQPPRRRHIQIRRPQQTAREAMPEPDTKPVPELRETAPEQSITGLPDWNLLPPRGVVRRPGR